MAVPVIQSVSNAAYIENTASLVITKPTGLAVGNTMIAIVGSSSDDASAAGDITPPAGWATVTSISGGVSTKLYAFRKIADSGDVAASNFTFTNSDTSESTTVGSIFRLSGSPVITNSVQGEDTNADTAVSFSVNQSVNHFDTLFVMAFLGKNLSGSNSYTSYTINGTNPTWTEERDTLANYGRSHTIAIATSSIADIRTITNFGATAATSGWIQFTGIMLFIHETTGSNGTNALLEVSPTVFNNAGVDVGGNGTNALLEVEPEIFNQSGVGRVMTDWQNESKPTTSWNNETL